MIEAMVLDTGILGMATHPRANADFAKWFDHMLRTDHRMIIAEVADYELRRELIRAGKDISIERLNRLKSTLTYRPITTPVMLRAAQLWAESRKRGQPTADSKELDCDVILAAQAIEAGAIVVTENIGHLSQFVETMSWKAIEP